MKSVLRSVVMVAAVAGASWLGVADCWPRALGAALPVAPIDEWSSSTRIVTIDGREVSVTVTAWLVSTTASEGSTATATVTLRAVDGDAPPAGLTAEHIRMQRVNQPTRIVHRDLIELDPMPVQTGDSSNFGIESGFKTAARGARFRTTVRLNFDGRDMLVPMGTIRVNTNVLVDTDPVDGGLAK